MLFNSWEFLLFFLVVASAMVVGPRRWHVPLLLLASWFFYAWWDWRFLGLLVLSTAVDWFVARRIEAHPPTARVARRRWLLVSLTVNLAILGVFKYLGFFVESAVELLEALHVQAHAPVLEIVLPVGVSFYTFQTMAYTIDVHRGRVAAERDPVSFALYVAWFPQLVAGPIERADRLLPQLRAPRRPSWEQISTGAHLVFMGLVRKVGIADVVAPHVDRIFDAPGEQSSAALALGVVLFALQIYGDFAGYSAIARGTSRMLGVELMENFRWPYLATNITEFWRRWHISLSSWLRDYLYIPLGGNRRGRATTLRNLMLTMLLGGLWHGASFSFVVWGGLHGLALAVHRRWGQAPARGWIGRGLGWALTMAFVLFAWVFFRAETVTDGFALMGGIFRGQGGVAAPWSLAVGMIVWTAVLDLPQARRRDETALLTWPWPLRGVFYAACVLLMVVLERAEDAPFIYFRF